MSEMDLHDSTDDYPEPPTAVAADAPEADALEQRAEVRGHGDPLAEALSGDVGTDADAADRADQERAVDLDEDDYR